jgi:hypothetical protein
LHESFSHSGLGYYRLERAIYSSDTVSILMNSGNESFQSAAGYAVGDQPQNVEIGDVNGDARPDWEVANNGNAVSVFGGNGNGPFQAAVNYKMFLNLLENWFSLQVQDLARPVRSPSRLVFRGHFLGHFAANHIAEVRSNHTATIILMPWREVAPNYSHAYHVLGFS